MRAEQSSAEHAIDLRDRSPPVVLQRRWPGLTNKSHKRFHCPCPAHARTTKYGPESGWWEASTYGRCLARQCHRGCRLFAARLAAHRLLQKLALGNKKTFRDRQNKHWSAHGNCRNRAPDKVESD